MGLLASIIYVTDKHWERERVDPKSGKPARLNSFDDKITQRIIFVNRVIELFLFLILVSMVVLLGFLAKFYLEMERAQRFRKCDVKDDCPDSSKYLCVSSFQYDDNVYLFKGSKRCVYKARQGKRCPPNLELDSQKIKCITTDSSKVESMDHSGNECTNHSDCSGNSENVECHDGWCVTGEKCEKHGDCDRSTEICLGGFCKFIPDCVGDDGKACDIDANEICTISGCETIQDEEVPSDDDGTTCGNDSECSGDKPRCLDSTCVECKKKHEDTDCPDNKPRCTDDGTCVECTKSTQDTDCSGDKVCSDFKCKSPDKGGGGGGTFPGIQDWVVWLLLTVFLFLPLAVLAARKLRDFYNKRRKGPVNEDENERGRGGSDDENKRGGGGNDDENKRGGGGNDDENKRGGGGSDDGDEDEGGGGGGGLRGLANRAKAGLGVSGRKFGGNFTPQELHDIVEHFERERANNVRDEIHPDHRVNVYRFLKHLKTYSKGDEKTEKDIKAAAKKARDNVNFGYSDVLRDLGILEKGGPKFTVKTRRGIRGISTRKGHTLQQKGRMDDENPDWEREFEIEPAE